MLLHINVKQIKNIFFTLPPWCDAICFVQEFLWPQFIKVLEQCLFDQFGMKSVNKYDKGKVF